MAQLPLGDTMTPCNTCSAGEDDPCVTRTGKPAKKPHSGRGEPTGPRIGSLFSGYAGLDLGVESVTGGHTVWVSDIETGPITLLKRHFPGVPNLGDVSMIDWAGVEPIDILTGGFPCQDLSSAGNRRGMREGTRSGLWGMMARAIDHLRPGLVVIENVRGLLSACGHSELRTCPGCASEGAEPHDPVLRALGRVLGDLADLGYDARWTGIRASDVGAPHSRYRVFVIAHPQGTDPSRYLLPQPTRVEHSGGSLAPVPLLPTPLAVNRARSGANASGPPPLAQVVDGLLLPTPMAGVPSGSGSGWSPALPEAVNGLLLPTPLAVGAIPYAGPGRDGEPRSATLAETIIGSHQHTGLINDDQLEQQRVMGRKATTLTNLDLISGERETDWQQYAGAINRWGELLGRKAPAPIEQSPDGFLRLSARFTEWMMGLPDGWVTSPENWVGKKHKGSYTLELRLLGNGVVPQQAAAALVYLIEMETPT